MDQKTSKMVDLFPSTGLTWGRPFLLESINPNVAKAGGLQSQGAEGEAVIIDCEPLATLGLKSSGFPDNG